MLSESAFEEYIKKKHLNAFAQLYISRGLSLSDDFQKCNILYTITILVLVHSFTIYILPILFQSRNEGH